MNIVDLIRRARRDGDFGVLAEGIPYMKTMGIEIQVDDGRLTATLAAAQLHIGNPWLPALHGGVVGGLLETAAILQLVLEQKGDHLPKPINVTVDYLRSGRIVPTCAAARITRRGRRVANVQAHCWQDNPASPIATLAGHFLVG